MRITTQMLSTNAVRDLQANMQRLAKSQEQVSTMRRLNRPSDDPAQTRIAVNVRDALAEIDQFGRNIDAANRTLSATESALAGGGDLMQRAHELALQGATGTYSPAERQAMGQEVDQIIGSMLEHARAKSGDSFLFSGFRTDVAPYATAGGSYQGDAGAILARTIPGTTVQINITADVAFGPALQALATLSAELNGGTQVSSGTIAGLDAGQTALIAARSLTGARQNRLADTQTTLDDAKFASTSLLSQLEDVDMAQAISDLSTRQAGYDAALKVNAKLLQTTLLDYLR